MKRGRGAPSPHFVSSPLRIPSLFRFIPSGYNTIYNDNDEIWQDGDFKDGQLYDGKVYIYGSNGLLLKVKVFKGGKFHSLGQL